MDILCDSYEPDQDQKLGGTSSKKKRVMLGVSGDTWIHWIILPATSYKAIETFK